MKAIATEGIADGDTKGKQTSHSKKPRKTKDMGYMVLWEARMGWGLGERLCSRHQWFSIQHLFLTQPLLCSFLLFPGRMLSPSLSGNMWPCDSEENMDIESGKHGANTGK